MLFLLMIACEEGPECSEEEACPFGSVCVEGACETRYCATSAQCEMEQYCADGACTDGCAADTDCYPGYECNTETAACEASGCTDTHTDCAYKQFCNEISGECFDASGYYCQQCAGDEDCGGGGNFCYGDYCAVTCETDAECPASFTCIPWVDLSGNILYYGCYTYCWLFEDGDYSDIEDGQAAEAGRPLFEALSLPECIVVEEAP